MINHNPEQHQIKLVVECSKGTYIRSLVKDIATKLGTIATVNKLRRIKSGDFQISQTIKLEEIGREKIIPFSP